MSVCQERMSIPGAVDATWEALSIFCFAFLGQSQVFGAISENRSLDIPFDFRN